MEKRKSGFYWVKYGGEWIPAQYDESDHSYPWQIMACDEIFTGGEFEEIGERIEPLGREGEDGRHA